MRYATLLLMRLTAMWHVGHGSGLSALALPVKALKPWCSFSCSLVAPTCLVGSCRAPAPDVGAFTRFTRFCTRFASVDGQGTLDTFGTAIRR